MCHNIKTLRAPYAVGVTDEDVRAAALQYVQTVGGFRLQSAANEEAFDRAVTASVTPPGSCSPAWRLAQTRPLS